MTARLPPHAPSGRFWLTLLAALALSACQSVPTKTYEIRQRAFTYNPGSLVRDYQEEYAYIEQRRKTVADGSANSVADHAPLALLLLVALLVAFHSAGLAMALLSRWMRY